MEGAAGAAKGGGAAGAGAAGARGDAGTPSAKPVSRRKAVRAALAAAASVSAEALTSAQNPVGIGVDIVSVDRMRHILARSRAFRERVFTEEERAYCESVPNSAAHFACRFAAREAVLKALGCGFGDGIGLGDVWVRRTPTGRPVAMLSGGALKLAREQEIREIALSLSFTHEEAVACAIAINEAAAEAMRKRPDSAELRQREFKANLDVLDGLDDEVEVAGGVRDVATTDGVGAVAETGAAANYPVTSANVVSASQEVPDSPSPSPASPDEI